MYSTMQPFEGVMGGTSPEDGRLEILASYQPSGLLDDPELAAITRFAAKLCDVPTSLVSMVEEDRQLFLAREGLNARETPRSESFCQYAMVQGHVMEVPDATADPRFVANALVTGAPFIRFYAGAPLLSDEGVPLGALCVISPEPRPDGLTAFQREGLSVLATAVMRRLKDHHARLTAEAELADSRSRFDALADAIPQMAWSTTPDGRPDYFNARWYEYTGAGPGEHDGDHWVEALHPHDARRAAAAWARAVASGEPYEVEYRLRRADGEYRWTLARGLPMKDAEGRVLRWFGTNTDVHERRMMAEKQRLLSRELNHRIKNIFSVVGGLVNLTAREHAELAPLADIIGQRIAALSLAHDYVRPDGGEAGAKAVTLSKLLHDLVDPYRDQAGARLEIEGEELTLGTDSVTPLALVFHELATNAVKYGALSVAEGRVTVSVRREGDEVLMDWREEGGPAIEGPTASGFGSQLVDMSIRRQLGGRYEHHWDEGGLRVAIAVPAGRI